MARSVVPLTESRIESAKAADKPIKLSDGGGMYLLVRPDGARYWRLDYRFGGKRRTLALGVYPQIGLSEARARREAARAQLAAGHDPVMVKRAALYRNPDGGDEQSHALKIIGEGVWDWSLSSGLVRHNAQWARLMGLADDGRLERDWREALRCLPEGEQASVMAAIVACQAGEAVFDCEHRVRHADGSEAWVRNRGDVVERGADGTPLRMVGSLCDVTHEKQAARMMQRRNLILRVIALANELLMAELPVTELMERICRELVHDKLFCGAWIGVLADDGVSARPVAEAGACAGHLDRAAIRSEDSAQVLDPTTTAIRNGTSVINDDSERSTAYAPLRDSARRQGYRSSAATPFRVHGKVAGVLNVYAADPHAFGPGKVMLLEKLASDLGVAIAQRAALAALRESEARFRLISSVATDFLYACSVKQGDFASIDWATASQETVFGYTPEEIVARGCWSCLVHPDDQAVFDRHIARLPVGQRSQCELRIVGKSGGIHHIRAYSLAVQDESGVQRLYGACQDITARRQAEARIEFLAHHDVLTGLPNRVLLRDRFELAVARAGRTHSRVAMLFIDLDHFKMVNDSLGHAAGDQLLLEMVKRLAACTRESDTISRQGGDEFILVLNDLPDLDTVERIADEILERIAEPVEIQGHALNMSCSIGIAVYPEDGGDFDTLMQKADLAMYGAKDAGRHAWRFFDETMNQRAQDHLLLRNRLYQALYRAEFHLHYQPQLDMASGQVTGVEALLRWRNPELGDVVPARFIPVAEDSGLIVSIGAWVLEEACRQAQSWRKQASMELGMSVNLSALQFRRPGLVETVAGALQRSGLPPQLLELELTESILLDDVDNNLETVRRLKALGVRLSIDDFGTGYSSLSYLKRFAVDRLKIDRSFVRDIGTDPDDAAIVRAVIQLARSLRLGIIAEGVETPEQLEFLRSEGCEMVQGYLLSRPLAPAALRDFMERRLVAG
ncbi:MAG: EAL domain-containing protein [Thiobacillus sp.]|nr:EAL domain-containing protein [Thiobacillus sp.]